MQSDFRDLPPLPSSPDEFELLLERCLKFPRPPFHASSQDVHDLIRRMQEESVLLPARYVEILILAGLIHPEALPCLKVVELAPGVLVDTDRLRWDPVLQCLLYHTAVGAPHPADPLYPASSSTGGWRRLDPVFRFLSFGDDFDDYWVPSSFHSDAPSCASGQDGGESAPLPTGWRRVCLELQTVIETVCIPRADLSPSALAYAPLPTPLYREDGTAARLDRFWTAVDVNGRWLLTSRGTGARPLYEHEGEAREAADRGLLDPGNDLVWLDSFNATDPLDE